MIMYSFDSKTDDIVVTIDDMGTYSESIQTVDILDGYIIRILFANGTKIITNSKVKIVLTPKSTKNITMFKSTPHDYYSITMA